MPLSSADLSEIIQSARCLCELLRCQEPDPTEVHNVATHLRALIDYGPGKIAKNDEGEWDATNPKRPPRLHYHVEAGRVVVDFVKGFDPSPAVRSQLALLVKLDLRRLDFD